MRLPELSPAALAKLGGDQSLKKYSPDQPRDERGRWTAEGDQGAAQHPIIGRRPVHSATDGVVVASGADENGGSGWPVQVRAADRTTYVYSHMEQTTVPARGTRVRGGQHIGDIAEPDIQGEPLTPPNRNIPGTDIPDRGVPEDGRPRGLGPTPHEHTDPGILHYPPNDDMDGAIMRPYIPQDILPPGVKPRPRSPTQPTAGESR